jgi:hypothetical protein
MLIVCYYLFFITYSLSVKHSIGCWAYQSLLIAICFLCLVLFGSENVASASFPINNINKGRWTQNEHKIFMQEYEKYGNNCMQIARVLSTQTPAQIKKHAECFFKQNLKTNFAAVKRYWESLSSDEKAQVLVKHATEQQKYQQSLSPENKVQILCNDADAHRKQCKSLPPEKKVKNFRNRYRCT